MNNQYFGDENPGITPREQRNRALAREAAREGFVLLKNEGALPLRAQKIALFGMGARKTVKGGTGSGVVNERQSVSIEEGLEFAGFEITTKNYLDDFDENFDQAYKAWREGIENSTKGQPFHRAIALAIETPFRYLGARPISDSDIADSDTDTALYVLARQAGEGKDRKLEPGDYLLTETEFADLTKITASYQKTIVVINVGGFIDLSWLSEFSGVSALVFYGQGGMEGGHALAEVLNGQHSFCGKLVDTWATRYEDYPSAMQYSYLNGDLENEDYTEGIFVGYRYFDNFGIQPNFPFGFGLSYTAFSISVTGVAIDHTEVIATVKVINIGKTYSGKEVVQCYLSCPDGKLTKEDQRLVAFEKTKTLAPGEEQIIQLCFPMESAASYDEEHSAWVLEPGEYVLRIGNSSRNTMPAAVLTLESLVVTEQCRPCCPLVHPLAKLNSPERKSEILPDSLQTITLDPTEFITKHNEYELPDVVETAQETSILDALTPPEMAELLRGGDLQNMEDGHIVVGAAGKTAITLLDKGIGNVVFADGPSGLNIVNQVFVSETGEQIPVKIPEKFNWGSMANYYAKRIAESIGQQVWRYATAWPVHMVLAQSWNLEIVEKVGHALGEEMSAYGITLWLAPALNIHRNPLCGRTFEYFSEDPLISGKMAAALTYGVQSWPGLGVTLKHFAANNQEDNRTEVSSNVSERALREIYLKGFEIAVKQSQPKALMTSYNRINGIYAPNNHDLLTDILRCEWGFEGPVMTDWGSCEAGRADPALCAPAGNDLVMPGSEADRNAILEAVKSGAIYSKTLRQCAGRVLRIILESGISGTKE